MVRFKYTITYDRSHPEDWVHVYDEEQRMPMLVPKDCLDEYRNNPFRYIIFSSGEEEHAYLERRRTGEPDIL